MVTSETSESITPPAIHASVTTDAYTVALIDYLETRCMAKLRQHFEGLTPSEHILLPLPLQNDRL